MILAILPVSMLLRVVLAAAVPPHDLFASRRLTDPTPSGMLNLFCSPRTFQYKEV